MKYVKVLGLAGLMTAALMSLIGVGTASATVLCAAEPANGNPATKGTVCPTNHAYIGGTEIHAVLEAGEHATITDDEKNADVTCKKSTIKASTENEGAAAETVRAKVEALTFEECTSPFFNNGACTVKTLKPGTLELHWIPDSFHGTITSSGAEITTNCESIFGPVHCIYNTANTDLGVLTGGVMAEGKATADIESAAFGQQATSALCPVEAFWDGKYEVTSPKPLYVAAHT